MKIKLNILFVIMILSTISLAQQKSGGNYKTKPLKLRNLKVGDKVPGILISKIINDKYGSANILDFNDRLLILDFWFTTCSTCIEGLPHMVDLQNEFGNKIKILPVTYEDENRVRSFLKTNRYVKNLNLPTVIEDKTLSKWFKHVGTPHEVWIYKGKVVALTWADYVTSDNIRKILRGEEIKWPVKNDFLPLVGVKEPLMTPNTLHLGIKKGLKRYASVFGFQENSYSATGVDYDSIGNTRRTYIINLPVLNVYMIHWNIVRGPTETIWPEPSHIILEVKDPGKYVRKEGVYDIIHRRNAYICYESISPNTGQTLPDQSMEIIKDLDYLMGLYGRYEKRKIKCLVLYRTNNEELFKSVSKQRDSRLDGSVKIFRKDSFKNLVFKLNSYSGNPPVFDGTGYTGNVDLDLKIDSWKNIPDLRRNLQTYGLDLKEEERELEVFVLTEISRK